MVFGFGFNLGSPGSGWNLAPCGIKAVCECGIIGDCWLCGWLCWGSMSYEWFMLWAWRMLGIIYFVS